MKLTFKVGTLIFSSIVLVFIILTSIIYLTSLPPRVFFDVRFNMKQEKVEEKLGVNLLSYDIYESKSYIAFDDGLEFSRFTFDLPAEQKQNIENLYLYDFELFGSKTDVQFTFFENRLSYMEIYFKTNLNKQLINNVNDNLEKSYEIEKITTDTRYEGSHSYYYKNNKGINVKLWDNLQSADILILMIENEALKESIIHKKLEEEKNVF